ncbi:MAG: hypothetical protein V4689_20720 [Verrucomicrobiota bacterium]
MRPSHLIILLVAVVLAFCAGTFVGGYTTAIRKNRQMTAVNNLTLSAATSTQLDGECLLASFLLKDTVESQQDAMGLLASFIHTLVVRIEQDSGAGQLTEPEKLDHARSLIQELRARVETSEKLKQPNKPAQTDGDKPSN